MPSASQGDVIDIDDDESPDNHEEEDINELYCVMRSTVVGIQYYTGMSSSLICSRTPSYGRIQAWLDREKKSHFGVNRPINMIETRSRVRFSFNNLDFY
jgi:hypothetical protein